MNPENKEEPKLYENHPNDSRISGPLSVAPSVVARYGTGGGNVPLVGHPVAIPLDSMNLLSRLGDASDEHSIQDFVAGDPMFTLTKGHHHGVAQTVLGFRKSKRASSTEDNETWVNDGRANCLNLFDLGDTRTTHAIVSNFKMEHNQEPISFQPGNLRRQAGADPSTEAFPTLKCDSGDQMPHVAYVEGVSDNVVAPTVTTCKGSRGGCSSEAIDELVSIHQAQQQTLAPTLTASNDPSRSPQSSEVTAQVEAVQKVTMQVRRLTPIECERLQGFPDNWTQISWKGKAVEDCPDGPRYKACGNSMATPCMKWIGERIDAAHKKYHPEG
jgi:site-specific DNA-cytosine methylase